jgi:hypothetical protein
MTIPFDIQIIVANHFLFDEGRSFIGQDKTTRRKSHVGGWCDNPE